MAEILQVAVAISAINQFSTAFAQASAGLHGIHGAALGLTAGLAAAGPAIAVFAGTMAIDFIKSTVQAAAAFEKEMLRVQAVTQATKQEYQDLTDFAMHMGETTEWTAKQSADAMRAFGMAGFEMAEIYDAVPVALDLATASVTDMGTAARITANILRAFNMESSEARRVGDVLTATFSNSFAELEDLGHTMKMTAPLAYAAGLSFEETAAAAGKLGDAGLRGTLAGTGLRQSLVKLLRPTGGAQEAMARLNLRLQTLNEAGEAARTTLEAMMPELTSMRNLNEQLSVAGSVLNINLSRTGLILAENNMEISLAEASLKALGDQQVQLNSILGQQQDELSSVTNALSGTKLGLQLVNAQIKFHENSIADVTASYSEWRGNLDHLGAEMSEVSDNLKLNENSIRRNNLELSLHQSSIDTAMLGYVEWRGSIDKTQAELKTLQNIMNQFSMDQKKNAIEIMSVQRNAEKQGRELSLSEETRIKFLEGLGDDLTMKQQANSIKQMEAKMSLEAEEKKAERINANRKAQILATVTDELAAIEQLKLQNKELQIINTEVSLQKLELMGKIRLEEAAVTEENKKRSEIIKIATAEETAILEELSVKKAELHSIEVDQNLNRLGLTTSINALEAEKASIIALAGASELKLIEDLTSANADLMLQRQEQALAVKSNTLSSNELALSMGFLEDEADELTDTIAMNVIGTVGFVEMLVELEEKMVKPTAMLEIFGTRGGTAMLALKNQGVEALQNLTNEVTNSEDALKNMAGTIRESVSVEFELLKSKWDAMKIELGTELFPVLLDLADIFKDLIDAAGPIIPLLINAGVLAVEPLIVPLGYLAQGIKWVMEALEGLGVPMETVGFIAALVLNPALAPMIVAFALLKGAIWLVRKALEPFKDEFAAVGAVLSDVWHAVLDPMMVVWNAFNNAILLPLVRILKNQLNKELEGCKEGLAQIMDIIGRVVTAMQPLFDILSDIADKFADIGSWIASGIGAVGKLLGLEPEDVRAAKEFEEKRAAERKDKKLFEHSTYSTNEIGSDEEEYLPEEESSIYDAYSYTPPDLSGDILSGGYTSGYGGGYGSGTTINIEHVYIHADDEPGGRAAAKAFYEELKSLELRGLG